MKKVSSKVKIEKLPAVVAIVILLLSFIDFPYGFYTLLRIIVTGIALYYAYHLHKKNETQEFWFWVFTGIAILFNPFISIYLYDKSVWGVIDLVVAVLLLCFIRMIRKNNF